MRTGDDVQASKCMGLNDEALTSKGFAQGQRILPLYNTVGQDLSIWDAGNNGLTSRDPSIPCLPVRSGQLANLGHRQVLV